MKVTKKSWHYKLATSTSTDVSFDLRADRPVSLCQYFWAVVGSGMLWVVIGWFALFLSWVLLTPLATFFVAFTGTDLGSSFIQVSSEIGWASIPFFWMLIPLMIGWNLWREGQIEFYPKWMNIDIEPSCSKKEKKPSLIIEWVKAKKARVCPLVEVSGE